MLRTIAYIIFLCTGIFAFTLVVLFFRSQSWVIRTSGSDPQTSIIAQDSNTLDRIKRAYQFRKSQQNDIFGAFIFTFDVDITVADRVRMYVFKNDYSLIRRNFLLLDSIYNFQDTTDFFGKTMFLNDKQWDGQIVRFITEVNGQTLGFEVLRDEYNTLKSLLLQ